ncbi:MAG TPA: nitrilase-related carbon-nitrogen hydrolase, partial [Terriglobales bacterium]|nr:nitrilase-related carbon-nitrogen hydrolase [Terriglobales bacterium]
MNPRVSVAQMDCKLGNVKHNLKTIHHLAEKAARSEPDILCFPELATTGYSLNARWRKFSENIPGPATERLAQIANEHGFYLVCGMSELDSHSKHIFNSSVLLSPNGRIVGVYRKVHLWDKERQYFTPGDSFRVFNTKIGKIGLGICYDLEFPESARAFAVQGANMVVYSSAEPHPFEDYVEIYL